LLHSHNDICGEEISACCLDDRRRKILIGDVKGRIGVYNVANGQLMKTTHFENESVVVSLEYFDEGKCFVAGFQNGLTCIFDENDMEDCHLVRSFEHFNRHKELLMSKFDHHSNTVATAGGSTNLARLWNYNSGKCDTELVLGHSPSTIIVDLMLLHPYPLVMTSDTTGNVILWGSRGTRWQGLRIAGFLNATPSNAEYEKRTRRADEEEDVAPLRALPPPLPKSARALKRMETEKAAAQGAFASQPSFNSSEKGTGTVVPTKQRGLRNSFNPLSEGFRIDPILKASSEQTARLLFEESEGKWGRTSPAQTMCWDSENARIYTGDELGNIRCFDLSDVFQDLRVETLLEDSTKHRILGLCRSKIRNSHSAVPPMFEMNISDEFDACATHYLLGQPGNAMSYLGVQYVWSFLGHNDRIISCSLVPTLGLLTSGADRLVKMWSFDGLPIGVLLQSVPVGTKSRSWELNFDVDKIIEQENETLDQIIGSAAELANSPDKPDISRMTTAEMQIGQETADFSKSELRQRIEKSSKILGLDFPKHEKFDFYHHMNQHVGTTGTLASSQQNKSDNDNFTIGEGSVGSSNTGKSLVEALKEIKSTDSAVDYEMKTKQMTIIQQKRKAHKLMNISKDYEAKTGVKVKLHTPTANDELEEKSQKDLDKLLTATSHFAKISQQPPSSAGGGDALTTSSTHSLPPIPPSAMISGHYHNNNNNNLTLEEPSLGSDLGFSKGSVGFPSPNNNNNTPHHNNAHNPNRRTSTVKSKIMESIKNVHDTGPRTISMINSCRKYSTYTALDEAIAQNNESMPPSNEGSQVLTSHHHHHGASPGPGPEELAEMRANREKKHKELMASMVLNSDRPSMISTANKDSNHHNHNRFSRSSSGKEDHSKQHHQQQNHSQSHHQQQQRSSLATHKTSNSSLGGKLSNIDESLEGKSEIDSLEGGQPPTTAPGSRAKTPTALSKQNSTSFSLGESLTSQD
jgi:hypothetical protein